MVVPAQWAETTLVRSYEHHIRTSVDSLEIVMAKKFLEKLVDLYGVGGGFGLSQIMDDFSDIGWWEIELIGTSPTDAHNHIKMDDASDAVRSPSPKATK